MIESSNLSTFCGLIDFSAELDVVLKNNFQSMTVFKGPSETIQNEILRVMSHVPHMK